jgi:hypothetical protein
MDQAGPAGDEETPAGRDGLPDDEGSSQAVTTRERSASAMTPDEPSPPARRLAWTAWLRTSAVGRHLVILVGYLVAGVVLTWPRFTYLTSHKLPNTRDAGSYVWGFWWVARQVEHFSNPWFTRSIAAPVGVQLGLHALMPLPSLLMMPVTVLFGPSASYNLLSVLMPGLMAYAMYRVARLWLTSQIGAIAAGAFFGISSMLAYQSFYLINLAAGALFLPLALEAAVQLRRKPGKGRAIVLGVVMGASLLTDQESAVLAGAVAVLALVPWLLVGAGDPAGTKNLAERTREAWATPQAALRRIGPAAGAAVIALVVASPQILAILKQNRAGGGTTPAHLLAVSYINYGVTLSGLFEPSPRVATFGLSTIGADFYHHGLLYNFKQHVYTSEATPMFGIVLTLLALFGLAVTWRRHKAWLLALLWLGCAALALGPVLYFTSSRSYIPLPITYHGVRMSELMPYTWFVRIPGLSSFREAGRLAELGLLGAALLAGSAVDWLRYHARPVMAVVLVLSLLELGWSGNPPGTVEPAALQIGTMATSMPKVDDPIAADHSNSIVVDFPFGIRGGIPLYGQAFAPQVQVLQTHDGHPRAVGFISRVPTPTIDGIKAHPFYNDLTELWNSPLHPLNHKPITAAEYAAAASDAKKMNVGWFVVWPWPQTDRDREIKRALAQYLAKTGFRLDYHVGGIQVYRPAGA